MALRLGWGLGLALSLGLLGIAKLVGDYFVLFAVHWIKLWIHLSAH